MKFYINGQYVSQPHATLSVLDLGLLRGYGAFEYLRTYDGRPFHLHEHLLRLHYSANQIGLTLPCSLKELEQIVATLLEGSTEPRGIKIFITGGMSTDHLTFENTPSLIAFTHPLPSVYTQGISVITTSLQRSSPKAKTTQYTPAILALQEGKKLQAQEALYLNAKAEILEATTSNFFAFKQGTLYTCRSDEVLIGITSEITLHLAQGHFPIQREALPLAELEQIEEAFLTSTNKEILPVVKINGRAIGSGQVGPGTKQLQKLFLDYTQQKQWPILPIARYLRIN
jgi:branched-chain amino acid aminotransferase